jgi:DNA-binding Xre family transcriptional regulator
MTRHAVNWWRIAAAVDEVRKHHGLADELGIANSTLSRLRTGNSLSADNLANILAWLYPRQIPAWVCQVPDEPPA